MKSTLLVSTNFVELFERGDKEYDITLRDQDLIVVPAKDYTVYVVGHVKNPGLIPYVPGQDASYYIKNAGGYNVDAWKRKMRIQRAGTGEMVSAKNAIVEMGDIVYVPEKIESENLTRDVALTMAQVATFILVIVQTYWYATRN